MTYYHGPYWPNPDKKPTDGEPKDWWPKKWPTDDEDATKPTPGGPSPR